MAPFAAGFGTSVPSTLLSVAEGNQWQIFLVNADAESATTILIFADGFLAVVGRCGHITRISWHGWHIRVMFLAFLASRSMSMAGF